jgi:cytoskeletal protein CcmA (bactofilin family)
MAEMQVRNIDEADIDTVLAEDIDFDGEISFEQPLLVKGKVTGEIRSSGDLFVHEGAVVEATIAADVVSVKGRVSGDIAAKTRLELFATSRVSGNISAPDLIIQSGCRFNGTCKMPDNGHADSGQPDSGHETENASASPSH